MDINELVQELEARLPELEWKISTLGASFSARYLPRGLFRPRLENSAASCVAEIKKDLQALAAQKSEYAAYYLAQRIQQKINVLVTLCQLDTKKSKKEETVSFSLQALSTRQQWLQSLEEDLGRLNSQKEAMERTLRQMQARADMQGFLALQAELGELEKRLTLAKEALDRAQRC